MYSVEQRNRYHIKSADSYARTNELSLSRYRQQPPLDIWHRTRGRSGEITAPKFPGKTSVL